MTTKFSISEFKNIFYTPILAFALASTFLVSCGQSRSERNLVGEKTKGYFNPRSCEYSLNEGSTLQILNTQMNQSLTTAFGKRFFFNEFEPVFRTSLSETIRYMKSLGLSIYKAPPVSPATCSVNNLSFLQAMPSDIKNTFDRGSADLPSDQAIFGLYLPKGNKRVNPGPSTDENAAIVLRENVSRWTAVHELMHHLFYTYSTTEEGFNEQDSFDTLKSSGQKLNQIFPAGKVAINSSNFEEVRQAIYARFFAMDNILIHYTLEEATIEDFLKTYHSKGALVYAPESSNGYLNSSLKSAAESYINYQKIIDLLLKYEPQDRLILELQDKITDRLLEIRGMAIKYNRSNSITEISSGILNSNDSRKNTSKQNLEECHHPQRVKKVLEKVIQENNRILGI